MRPIEARAAERFVVSSKLRIGVAGAGVFGAHHASKYAASNDAILVGVLDRHPDRAEALANRFGARVFDDEGALLDGVDALVIATPAVTHYDFARAALEAGRHVFVEKPVALTPEDADELIALADARSLILQVGHQERYVAAEVGLFERREAPLKIDCVRCAAPSGRCEDVSVVFDLMVHDLDLVRHLTKSELETLDASGDAHEAFAEMSLANGAVASFKASRRAAHLERRMTLVYEDGFIEIDFIKRDIVNSTPAALRSDLNGKQAPLAFVDPLGFGANQFVAAVLSGEAPVVSGRDGRDAVAWARRIEDAASISAGNVNGAHQAETRERLLA